MPPHLAQGAAQTFLDGAVLLDCLSKNDNISSSVGNYSKLRLKSIKKVTNMFSKKFKPYQIGYVSKDTKRINTSGNLKW